MKDNVLAMKVVLPNGEAVTTSRRALKSSAGYDLTRLMIGAEGTLGIITRAVLTLHPPRASRHTALVALDGYDAAVDLLRRLSKRFGNDIGAFEIMWPDFFDFGVALTAEARSPFAQSHPLYALIEHASFDAADDGERFASALGDALALAICHCWRAPMLDRMAAANERAAEARRQYTAKLAAQRKAVTR